MIVLCLYVQDTLLPFCTSRKSIVEPNKAHNLAMQASTKSTYEPFTNANVCDALENELIEIEEFRVMPKWLVQNLYDNILDAPLPACPSYGSYNASYESKQLWREKSIILLIKGLNMMNFQHKVPYI